MLFLQFLIVQVGNYFDKFSRIMIDNQVCRFCAPDDLVVFLALFRLVDRVAWLGRVGLACLVVGLVGLLDLCCARGTLDCLLGCCFLRDR